MKQLKLMILVLTALCLVSAAFAAAVPVTVEYVKLDGDTLTASAPNRVSFERGNEIEVKVSILATANAENIQIEAFLSGYEYSDFDPISDATHVFDVENGVTYKQTLTLKLPDNVDEASYKLRVLVTDRYSDEIIQNFNLKIDVPRHSIEIKDVWFTPENSVAAGEYLIASVRLKNMGDKDEEGLKVVVSIPELGISATDYIDTLEKGDSISSEELYLKIPRCNIKDGRYEIKVGVVYDESTDKAADFSKMIEIRSAGPCETAEVPTEKFVVSLETLSKEIVAGGAGITYPITITNTGTVGKTLVFTLPNVAFGSVKVSPSTIMVLGAGETKTAYIFVTAGKDAEAGDHQFAVALDTVDGKTLKELTFTASVAQQKGMDLQFTRALEIALVVLIIILVLFGLIFGLRRIRGTHEESEEQVSGETYY